MSLNDYDRSLDILSEPRGGIYNDLLRLAYERCHTFSLVWRVGDAFYSNRARRVEFDLQPFLLEEREVQEWPGTTLLGGTARFARFSLQQGAIAILARTKSLYAWRHPHRPEDLAFYVADGRWWLASIAHERDSYFNPELVSPEELCTHVPGLRVRVRRANAE